MKRQTRTDLASALIGISLGIASCGYSHYKDITLKESQPPLCELYSAEEIQNASSPRQSPHLPNERYSITSIIRRHMYRENETPLDKHIREKDMAEIAIGGGLMAALLATTLYRKPQNNPNTPLGEADSYYEEVRRQRREDTHKLNIAQKDTFTIAKKNSNASQNILDYVLPLTDAQSGKKRK